MFLLSGGRLLCPHSGLDDTGDLLVRDGLIAEMGPHLAPPPGARVIDCAGLWVGPGLVDLCADLADPGAPHREDLESGAEAAAAGGYTTVVLSPDTDPIVDSPSVLRDLLARGQRISGARLRVAGALSHGLRGEAPAELGLLAQAGAVAFSDGRRLHGEAEALRRCLEYARPWGLPVLLRPGEASLEARGLMHEGPAALRLGLRGLPAAAEEIGLSRIIALCELTGAAVIVSQVSTARAVEQLARAQARGLPIHGAVGARHLLLCDEDVERNPYDPAFKLLPPLRSAADRRALVEGVRAGVLSLIHADHVPWGIVDKEHEFDAAAFGAAGLETAVHAALAALGDAPLTLFGAMATRPGALIGQRPLLAVGAPADLLLLDPLATRPPGRPQRSRSAVDPLARRTLPGQVVGTLVGGQFVFGPIPHTATGSGAGEGPRAGAAMLR